MADKELPAPETLRKLLAYNPETGELVWRARPVEMFEIGAQSAEIYCARWNGRWAAQPAFTAASGDYRYGKLFGRQYYAHRVIWALVHGEWPEHVDHINGDGADNRLCNLRAVTPAENQRNQKRATNNTSGATGVCWFKRAAKWQAAIMVNGRSHKLGMFISFEEACAARKAAELHFGFHPNHGR